MYVVILSSLFAILFTFLSKYKSFSKGLELGFVIITIIGCIHYNYGNDYEAYYRMWETFSRMSLISLLHEDMHGEIGWRLLNWLFKFHNGFFVLVALLNIVQNYIFYRFIKGYVSKRWQWLGMFIYLCTTTYYPLFFSMMRQALAMSLTLTAFMYLYPPNTFRDKYTSRSMHIERISVRPSFKRLVVSFIIVIMAATFHVSALVFLPALIIGYSKLNHINLFAILVLIVTIALFFIPGISSTLLTFALAMESLDAYNTYTDVGYDSGFGLGFAVKSLPFIVSLYFMLFRANELTIVEKQLILVSYLAFLTYPFISIASLFDRIGSYFSILHIAVVPILYSKIKQSLIRFFLVLIMIIFTFYMYKNMFTSLVWRDTMYEFHSIFEIL